MVGLLDGIEDTASLLGDKSKARVELVIVAVCKALGVCLCDGEGGSTAEVCGRI